MWACICRMFWIAFHANLWVYPVFEVLDWTQRALFLVTCWLLMFACYFVGELLTSLLWREFYSVWFSSFLKIPTSCENSSKAKMLVSDVEGTYSQLCTPLRSAIHRNHYVRQSSSCTYRSSSYAVSGPLSWNFYDVCRFIILLCYVDIDWIYFCSTHPLDLHACDCLAIRNMHYKLNWTDGMLIMLVMMKRW